jgi:hypothetical protein
MTASLDAAVAAPLFDVPLVFQAVVCEGMGPRLTDAWAPWSATTEADALQSAMRTPHLILRSNGAWL